MAGWEPWSTGECPTERIALNDDTLWSGGPKDCDNPGALKALPEIRRLIFAGRFAEAHELGKKMMGPYTQSYLPMGELVLTFDTPGTAGPLQVRDYLRELDLDRGVATTRYQVGDVACTREVFVSHPDQVMVVRLTTSRPRGLGFTARLGSRLRSRTQERDGVLVLRGKAPAHVDPNYYNRPNPVIDSEDEHGEGMNFECHLRAIADEGTVTVNDAALRVDRATTATLLLSAATSFNGFDRSPGRAGKDPAPIAAGQLDAASSKAYETLLRDHVNDHQRLFRRVALDLGRSPEGARELPTDLRVRKFGADDPGLVVLHFQYGRYLLIASSRPGTQPPNLQGIWNDEVRAPWSSNWTININTEMNMWPAEVTNLAECHEPLFELIRGLSVNGRKTARVNYGCGGWVSHHNADIWCQSAPVGDFGHGDATWALWPMSGPWLCQHLWQHYEFGGDRAVPARHRVPAHEGGRRVLPRLPHRRRQGPPGHRALHLARERLRHARRPAFGGEHGQHHGPGIDPRPVHALHRGDEDPRYRRTLPRPVSRRPWQGSTRSRSVPTAACRSGSGRSPTPRSITGTSPTSGASIPATRSRGRRRTCSRRPASRSKSGATRGPAGPRAGRSACGPGSATATTPSS